MWKIYTGVEESFLVPIVDRFGAETVMPRGGRIWWTVEDREGNRYCDKKCNVFRNKKGKEIPKFDFFELALRACEEVIKIDAENS